MATVEHRGTRADLLHRIVPMGVAALRRALEEADRDLPGFVWRELERYTSCGDLNRGFAWLVCDDCDHHRLVPFSCKGRAFCPACTGRRMAETAARWCDELLPVVSYRQWVLTLPWGRRKLLAYRPELARAVLQRALDQLFDWARTRARERLGLDDARTGAVTATQRFGSSLALNVHFHSLLPDGVWALGPDGTLVFHPLSPTRADLQGLVERIGEACDALFAAHERDEDEDPDDAQAVLIGASAAGRVAAGPRAGHGVRRLGVPRDADEAPPRRAATWDGYTLHASTTVAADRRDALERLGRYLLRGPLAKGRLTERQDGHLIWHLRQPWSDGTEAFVLSPLELVEKLAALVVRPRVHLVHYHGVFAPNAAWRPRIVDGEAIAARRAELAARREQIVLRKRDRRARHRRRVRSACPWAELLERVFGSHGFACPKCGATMRFRGLVLNPASAAYVLSTLGRSARAGPTGALFP